ncbi:protein PHLOEM PROTEIN 2-LIKE A1-like [Mangifera indica]|uniref:protein PHLOEM PROTEIN 2-LIKE A1-like n=1 Tax=Mangifera indica TaxID=29780 RepID=UPI001CF96E89|nr:protein PHLOEM PROTEIN 2-LIKE A1-like [Mangifera indica]
MASAQVQLPHNLQAILKEEDSQIDASSERPKDRIEFHARELTIYRGNDPTCWQWVYMPDTDGALVEVAVLLRIDRLDVSKVFSAKRLTPGKYYGVYFVLMMTDGEYGFKDHPVKFQLAIPNCHETIERKEDLSKLPKNKWTVVRLGEFATSCNMSGDLKISMFEQLQQVNPELNQDPIWLEIARLPIQ